MKSSAPIAVAMSLFLTAVGCESPSLPESAPQPAAEAKPAEPEKPMVAGAPGEELPDIAIPVTNDPRPVDPDDPIKGRRSKRAGGHLGAVAHGRFWAEHKLIYDQVKQNLMLYMATSGNGDFPKSNEEFFEKIIKGYNMKLPELEPEHEYVYVPEEPEAGLQIRLKQSDSKEGATPGGAAAASAPAAEQSAEAPAEDGAAQDEEKEPIYNIRERAAGIGGPALDIE